MDWWPCRPAGYDVTGCLIAEAYIMPWVMKRPGSITGLSIFARTAPAVGETVETRIAFGPCDLSATQYSATLILANPDKSNWVNDWDVGDYVFEVGWVVWVEHRAQGGTTAYFMEWVAEVTTP